MAIFKRKPRSFEAHVVAACERLRPDLTWKHRRKADKVVGADITINLANLRLTWDRQEGDARPAWLEGHLSEVLLGIGTAGEPASTSDLRAMIRPRVLVESARLDVLAGLRPSNSIVPHKILSDDLIGVLGVDSRSSIQLVTHEILSDLSSTFDGSWATGVENLRALPTDQGWSRVEGSVFISNVSDDYTNSRLLDPEHLDPLGIDGPAVVLLPHRNALVVAPLHDDRAIATACDLALQQLNEPAPICTKPFLYADGAFSPLAVDSGHPASELVAQLRLIDDDANIKQLLPQLKDLVDGDLHIGSFFVDEERLVSSTNWGPSPSLLPRSDEIVFVDDEHQPTRGMVAPWAAVAATMNSYVSATDHYPQRYRTNGLPDPALIRSIGQPLSSLPPF